MVRRKRLNLCLCLWKAGDDVDKGGSIPVGKELIPGWNGRGTRDSGTFGAVLCSLGTTGQNSAFTLFLT